MILNGKLKIGGFIGLIFRLIIRLISEFVDKPCAHDKTLKKRAYSRVYPYTHAVFFSSFIVNTKYLQLVWGQPWHDSAKPGCPKPYIERRNMSCACLKISSLNQKYHERVTKLLKKAHITLQKKAHARKTLKNACVKL